MALRRVAVAVPRLLDFYSTLNYDTPYSSSNNNIVIGRAENMEAIPSNDLTLRCQENARPPHSFSHPTPASPDLLARVLPTSEVGPVLADERV